MGEAMFVDPAGRAVVVNGERVPTEAEAVARYVAVRAVVRLREQRGGASLAEQRAARALGEALAHARGISVFELSTSLRAEISASYRVLLVGEAAGTSLPG